MAAKTATEKNREAGGYIFRTGDPLNIFGFDQSAREDLKAKLAESRMRQDDALSFLKEYTETTNEENKGLWSEYGEGLPEYEKKLNAILGAQNSSYDTLEKALGGYKNVEDLFQHDPQFAEHDARSRLREEQNLGKIGKLTGLKETAEEQLMRETARRNQERDINADRAATAQSLKLRGVYGGGAELAQALASEQETASRRSQEDMQANANAQQRGMKALETYQGAAGAMSAADDALSKFNASLMQQNSQLQAAARTTDNSAKQSRATTLNSASTTYNQMAGTAADKIRGDERAVTAGKTNVNLSSLDSMNNLTGLETEREATKQAQLIAEQKSGGAFSNLLNFGW